MLPVTLSLWFHASALWQPQIESPMIQQKEHIIIYMWYKLNLCLWCFIMSVRLTSPGKKFKFSLDYWQSQPFNYPFHYLKVAVSMFLLPTLLRRGRIRKPSLCFAFSVNLKLTINLQQDKIHSSARVLSYHHRLSTCLIRVSNKVRILYKYLHISPYLNRKFSCNFSDILSVIKH